MNLNKVFIIGNLTRDPELRSLPSGKPVTSFGVATNRVWKDQSGQKQEEVQFHNMVAFGRQAEIASQYLSKGSSVLIEGRLNTRTWDAQDGTKKSKTEIVTERLQLGPRRAGPSAGQAGAGAAPAAPAQAPAASGGDKEEQLDTIEYPDEDLKADEIPF